MDLIERYVALADRGPARRPGDLAVDLRRLLLARLEAQETALGRPLSAPEAAGEITGFARKLFAEAAAVMRRFEGACLGLAPVTLDIPEGES